MKNINYLINKEKGTLVVYEGISGSGKSEGVKNLYNHLICNGHKTVVIEWNSNKAIRSIVEKLHAKSVLAPRVYSMFQWMGFFIDYFVKIVPLLKKNHIVIADRYVYTALTRDVANAAGKRSLCLALYNFVRKPDLLFFYDTPPSVCHVRSKDRGKTLFHTNKVILKSTLLRDKDLFYLKKIRNEYIRLLTHLKKDEKLNIVVVNDDCVDVIKNVECYISQKYSTTV